MDLPLGVPDPMYLFELALEMRKSVREMTTGVPGMSAHELNVMWPCYFHVRAQEQAIMQEREEGAGR